MIDCVGMLNSEKALLCKLVNCQAESLNFVKQSSDSALPALIANMYRGENLQIVSARSEEAINANNLFNWQHPYILQFYAGVDLDQFAPRYEFEVLRNLYTLRDKIDHDLLELEPVMDDYMLLLAAEKESELDSTQLKAKFRAEQQILDFWLLYRKVVSIVGGFLMLEHFDDCLPIMIQKYHYCRKRFDLTSKLSKLNDRLLTYYDSEHELLASKLKQAKSLADEADVIQRQIKQFDRQILSIDQSLNELRDFYASDSSFCMHEKYRESGLCLNYLTRAERRSLAAEIVTILPNDTDFASNFEAEEFSKILAEFSEGTKQIKQQTEIQNLYNLLIDFVKAANCRVQSCIFSPFVLTVEKRNVYGFNLLSRRPKLLLWQNVAANMQANGLENDWLQLLNILKEHEQISNFLLQAADSYVDIDLDKIICRISDNVAINFQHEEREANVELNAEPVETASLGQVEASSEPVEVTSCEQVETVGSEQTEARDSEPKLDKLELAHTELSDEHSELSDVENYEVKEAEIETKAKAELETDNEPASVTDSEPELPNLASADLMTERAESDKDNDSGAIR